MCTRASLYKWMKLAYVGRRTNKMTNEWEISFAENAPTQFLILRDQMATPDIPNCAAMWTPENIAEYMPQFAVEPYLPINVTLVFKRYVDDAESKHMIMAFDGAEDISGLFVSMRL